MAPLRGPSPAGLGSFDLSGAIDARGKRSRNNSRRKSREPSTKSIPEVDEPAKEEEEDVTEVSEPTAGSELLNALGMYNNPYLDELDAPEDLAKVEQAVLALGSEKEDRLDKVRSELLELHGEAQPSSK